VHYSYLYAVKTKALEAQIVELQHQLAAALELLALKDKQIESLSKTTEQYLLINQQQTIQIRTQQQTIAKLEFELKDLKRLIFGSKRERFEGTEPPAKPGELFYQEDTSSKDSATTADSADTTAAATIEITYKKDIKPTTGPAPRGGRNEFPAHIERRIIEIYPQIDITGLKYMGNEVTETLELTPAKLIVIKEIRHRYNDPQTQKIHLAELPPKPIEKCKVGPSLISKAICEKYITHTPYYRFIDNLKQTNDIIISRSSFSRWTSDYIGLLNLLYEAHIKEVLKNGFIEQDETTFTLQKSATPGKSHQGYMWATLAPTSKLVYFSYQNGRSKEDFCDHLKDYKGIIITDGYEGYTHLSSNENTVHMLCWAHARRYFEKAYQNGEKSLASIMNLIQELYMIEREARLKKLEPEVRRILRQEKSKPILDKLKTLLDATQDNYLPQSAAGKAYKYCLTRWELLTKYIEYGEAEIDNNLVENQIRAIALGRKNFLFAGSVKAARQAAMMYSFLGTCKLLDINPIEWLSDVFNRINETKTSDIASLLPQNWKKSP